MSQRRINSNELVTCGQGVPILFWDPLKNGEPLNQIQYPYKVLTIQVSPTGQYVAFGTETNEVIVFKLLEAGQPPQFMAKGVGHSGPVTCLKWTPDSKQIISVSADASISVWNFYG